MKPKISSLLIVMPVPRRADIRSRYFVAAACFAMLLCLPLSVFAAAGAGNHHARTRAKVLSTEQIARLTLPSVVSLTVLDKNGAPAVQGSGFVVGPNLIATNLHVVNGAHAVTANFQNGRSEEVYGIVDVDVDHDIAILYADTTGVRPLAMQTDSNTPIGEAVVAVGSPEGLGGSISTGVVSGVRNTGGTKIIQTTAAISHGSSGGALIDPYGRVLGVTSFFLSDGQSLNFAYPAYYVKLLIPKRAPTYMTWALLEDKLKGSWAIDTPEDDSSPDNTPAPASPAPPANAAEDAAFTEKPLFGLKAFDLVVEQLQTDAKSAGLTEDTITNDVKEELHQAGIKVISEKDPDYNQQDPSGAYIYVNINSGKSDSNTFVYNIHVDVTEVVRLQRPTPALSFADTWSEGQIGYSDNGDFISNVRDNVKDVVNDFIKDYQTQNPKPAAK